MKMPIISEKIGAPMLSRWILPLTAMRGFHNDFNSWNCLPNNQMEVIKNMNCPFCQIKKENILVENEHFQAIADIRPVSKGHSLIVSKRHVADFFELLPEEAIALHELSLMLKQMLTEKYQPDGFKLLMNCGKAAGQTVFHFHMHVIPRYKGNRPSFRETAAALREMV